MRPYVELDISELELIIDRAHGDQSSLHLILAELDHRDPEHVGKLRTRVEHLIAVLEAPVRPTTIDRGGQGDAPTDSAHAPSNARMRSPAAALDTPQKWVPALSQKLQATWQPSDPTPVRYERALRLLIEDIQNSGSGAKTIRMEGGQRIRLTETEHAYRFPWDGNKQLLEGGAVEVRVGDQTATGSILSVNPSEVLISCADLGPTIQRCQLRVDNTAILLALADRMALVSKTMGSRTGPTGVAETSFNGDLAEGVLRNTGSTELTPVTVPQRLLEGLNSGQCSAVQTASSQPISYIWGPPGTGKTKTLAAVVRLLYEANHRCLICSTTNQAVDQILLKVCESLAGTDPKDAGRVEALHEGWIVRVGAMGSNGPLSPWFEWVSIAGVTSRKTRALRDELTAREHRADAIERQLLLLRRQLRAHLDLDAAIAAETAAERALHTASEEAAAHRRVLNELNARLAALGSELQVLLDAGVLRRLVMRSPARISEDVQLARAALPGARKAAAQSAAAETAAIVCHTGACRARHMAEIAVAGIDRDVAQGSVAEAERDLRGLRAAISDLHRRIENVAKTVVKDARVIGATTTRLFQSAQHTLGSFSSVVIDEASMLIPPSLYYAAGLATERVIVSGDFRQLSPIVESNESCLKAELGCDVFALTGIQTAFDEGSAVLKRTTMLEEQYRMADQICRLVSQRMYGGKLRTAPSRKGSPLTPSEPLSGPITLVDTSSMGPVVNKDRFGQWCNVMSGLTVTTLCHRLKQGGFASNEHGTVGVVVPYAGQRRVIERALENAGLARHITVGTVHRYQGDEKDVIVLDLVDGLGKRANPWTHADQPTDDGAKLFNVAFTRAKHHLIVVGDLAWLDRMLPASSFLRGWLCHMQDCESLVDAADLLALKSDDTDVYRYQNILASVGTPKIRLFNETDFLVAVQADLAHARRGIAIWSPFVTPQGVRRMLDLLKDRLRAGVKVRCVLRPPDQNGSMGEHAWEESVRMLGTGGVAVDIRASMHEKLVLIDDGTTWTGSLNPLSHSGRTRELMLRIEGEDIALAVAAFLAADPSATASRAAGIAYEQENPACGACGARTHYALNIDRARVWSCPRCGRSQDVKESGKPYRTPPALTSGGPPCLACGKPTRLRSGRYGRFWGCTGYPECTTTARWGHEH